MKRRIRYWLLLAAISTLLGAISIPVASAGAHRPQNATPHARNIILMVADGLGIAGVTAARIYKNGLDGPPLHMELPNVGYQRTHSADSTVTDSAAAASAWACGEKFRQGEICRHAQSQTHPVSILEWAKMKGKATGLVATSTITHATPAAFASHVITRKCETEIARQYIQVSRPDVILGGGRTRFALGEPDPCGTSGDFLAEARTGGYCVVYTASELREAVDRRAAKILGLFADEGLTPEMRRAPGIAEPHLWEMTAAAIQTLERNPRGFFLLVEGSQIDWANHLRDLEYQVSEILAFDQAVKTVLDWMDAKPSRKASTLLVILSDHETGGVAVHGPKDSLTTRGMHVEPGWSFPPGEFPKAGHTGEDTPVWSLGPGSRLLNRPAMENTEIFRVMKSVL